MMNSLNNIHQPSNNNQQINNEFLKQTAMELVKYIRQNGNISFTWLVAELLNAFMQAERDIFLSEYDESTDNKANGYYQRELNTKLGSLELAVPRDRHGNFRPHILPAKYKRHIHLDEVLKNLVLCSYSPNKMKAFLRSLNLPYSEQDMEHIKHALLQSAHDINSRQLNENYLILFIDAYHTQMKESPEGKIKHAVIYIIIGISTQLDKAILGFYIFYGKENPGDWISIFNQLIERGLKRVLLIVSDDFPGLAEAIKTLFPHTDHQLCTVHLKRNIFKNMSKHDAHNFLQQLQQIMLETDYETAVQKFEELCSFFQSKYPHFMKLLSSKKEQYLQYIKYPQQIRRQIRSTNVVESFNSRLENIRLNLGGYFQSKETAEVSIYVVITQLQSKWQKGTALMKSVRYELMQMFNSRFQTQNY